LFWAKLPVTVTLVMVSAALPVLLSVTACGALVDPTGVPVKVRVVGVRLTTGPNCPVPESATVWGLLGAVSVTATVPVIPPAAKGLKVTLMIQLCPTARAMPQLFVCAKLLLAAMEEMLSAAAPVLVIVTDCAALVVVTVWGPKTKLEGVNNTAAAGPPVPLKAIVCGLLAALSVRVTIP